MKAYQNENAVKLFSNECDGRELLKRIRNNKGVHKEVTVTIKGKKYSSREL